MIRDLYLQGGEQILLYPVKARDFRGVRLPGSLMFHSQNLPGEIIYQVWENPFHSVELRIFRFISRIKLDMKEVSKGLRLEYVLTGELHVANQQGHKTKLLPGQYHITALDEMVGIFRKGTACRYFITHYSPELLQQLQLDASSLICRPRQLSPQMSDLVQEMLHNPYDDKLRDFYYENCVRELLFLHLASRKATPFPGELTDRDIAAIYQADAIIQENLDEHFSIRSLSKMAGTNEFKLKKGFRQIFGMGVFGRLLYRRMERAKRLLETTDKPILEVSLESGYESVTGFINAFKKRFGVSPRVWRMKGRER